MTGSGALPAGAASLGPQEVTLTLDPATAAQLLAQHGAGAGAGQTVQLPGGRSLQMPLQQLFLPTQGGPPPPSSNPHAGGHRASAPPSFSGLPSPAQAQQQALLADMAAAGGGDPHQQQQEVINAMMLARAVQQQQQGQSQQQGVSIAGLEGLNLMALAGGEITPQMLLQGGMPITIAGPGPSQGQGQGQQRQQGGGGSGGGAGGQQQQQQVVRVVWENAGGSGAGRP